jgi:sec-independent protein translocase protein TatB
MFDFAWTEIALIGVVALVAIGPKDLPVAIKAVAEMVKKARRMAGEFQTHVDEMVREANLHEVRDQFNDLRRMDIKGKILDAVDGDKTMRNTIADNPFDPKPAMTGPRTPAIASDPAISDLGSSDPAISEPTILGEIDPAPPPVPVPDTVPATFASETALEHDLAHVPGLTEQGVLTRPEHVFGDSPSVGIDENALPAFIPPGIAAAGPPSPRALPPAFVPPAVVAARPRTYA